MNCILFGDNSLTVECANRLRHSGHAIEGIVTSAAPVTAWAEAHSVPVLPPQADLAADLARRPFDLLLSIAYLSVIPRAIVALPRVAAINFHDGHLPDYAGLNTPAWALMNRERQHGISWHLMTEQVDGGDVLVERRIDIEPDETTLSLNLKCYQAAIESFEDLLQRLKAGTSSARRQDPERRRYYGRFQRPAAAAVLSWDKDAETLAAIVRALDFGSYENPLALAKLTCPGRPAVVVRGAEATRSSGVAPGTIVTADAGGLRVATTAGDIVLRGLSTLDGTPISPESFLEAWGLDRGARMAGLTAERADRLTSLNRDICRHEEHWVRLLSSVTPISIPRSGLPGGDDRVGTGTLDMATPDAFAAYIEQSMDGTTRAQCIAAGLAVYFSRITGQSPVDLAFCDSELKALVEGAEDVFSAHVPVRFTCEPTEMFARCVTSAVGALEEARRHLSFARDTILRYPILRPLVGTGPCWGLPVMLEFVAELADGHVPSGCSLSLAVRNDGRAVRWQFDKSRLTTADVAAMQEQFTALLDSVARDPDRTMCEHDILGRQRTKILVEWNATRTVYSTEPCIHHLIEAQAVRTPGACALAYEDRQLTYAELDRRANRLAHHLCAKGVRPDGLVGLYLPRSIDMVVAMLATLKAGGAYLPLDPEFPKQRIQFMLDDAQASVIITTSALSSEMFDANDPRLVSLDAHATLIAREPESPPSSPVRSSNLAYVIYTSGSTGTPKGVLVEHRNVLNFFAGMDARLSHETPGVWLAVTSLSFDISVLELLWTLSRGFKVVLYSEAEQRRRPSPRRSVGARRDLSLFYFASDEGEHAADKYTLLLEGAKFADAHGFSAVWMPERHFHAFGGLYPNPSVTAAAVAAITERIGIRAGSCVLPLHHPIRVAEEWALVDNLSRGRVGVSFASGWQPDDFVLRPENFAERQQLLFDHIEIVRRLWRGETVAFPDGRGRSVDIRTLPRPVQAELPIWITAAGNPDTYRQAGERGFNLLTHLLGQRIDELADKLQIYREALEAGGRPADSGRVALMLHTFLGEDRDQVREAVREPMRNYLRSAVGLIEKAAWSFPTFRQDAAGDGRPGLDQLSPSEMEAVLDFAFERYFETSGLFGTPDEGREFVDRLRRIGVDDVACLIDFGVPSHQVLRHLEFLTTLVDHETVQEPANVDGSIAGLIAAHGVTHLQCTPSMMTMLLAERETREALGRLRQVMVGGELFPPALAQELRALMSGDILNMYGPTETTVWSAVHRVEGGDIESVPIGTPIANTQLYIADQHQQPVPVGVVGEVFIGGDGVVRGYHNRPELTAERFCSNPFVDDPEARLYRTGDLARYRPDGSIEILGRIDQQVKVRGYRIELGEIESVLAHHPDVDESVVAAVDEGEGRPLVAYLKLSGSTAPSTANLRQYLAARLPDYMIPSRFVRVERFPLTPNKKIDRKALAKADVAVPPETSDRSAAIGPPSNDLEGALSEIWMDVLKVARVGMEDNFFDLGGHSLLAITVHRQIQEKLQRQLPLTDLFRFPTIRALARRMGASDAAEPKASADARIEARKRSMFRRRGAVRSVPEFEAEER
jgi:natural product biosynthesis luciferase-like monooxygenase protein